MIKVTAQENQQKDYPEVVVIDDTLILVIDWMPNSRYFHGATLSESVYGNCRVGYYSASWNKKMVKPFYGTITLRVT